MHYPKNLVFHSYYQTENAIALWQDFVPWFQASDNSSIAVTHAVIADINTLITIEHSQPVVNWMMAKGCELVHANHINLWMADADYTLLNALAHNQSFPFKHRHVGLQSVVQNYQELTRGYKPWLNSERRLDQWLYRQCSLPHDDLNNPAKMWEHARRERWSTNILPYVETRLKGNNLVSKRFAVQLLLALNSFPPGSNNEIGIREHLRGWNVLYEDVAQDLIQSWHQWTTLHESLGIPPLEWIPKLQFNLDSQQLGLGPNVSEACLPVLE